MDWIYPQLVSFGGLGEDSEFVSGLVDDENIERLKKYFDICGGPATFIQAHTVLEMNYTDNQLTTAVVSKGLRPGLAGTESAWFCPVACNKPLKDSLVLMYLPGLEGTGTGLVVHEKALGKCVEFG
ncbi:unnamed protein product [Lactuca saligna]|uniref:Uncharacterized protein n=1 Tax=Lactuca saligna TaxID=75948 RepID=A0AA36EFL2_LACSI|nr:unnamed protein product [Lactuca saligna]